MYSFLQSYYLTYHAAAFAEQCEAFPVVFSELLDPRILPEDRYHRRTAGCKAASSDGHRTLKLKQSLLHDILQEYVTNTNDDGHLFSTLNFDRKISPTVPISYL